MKNVYQKIFNVTSKVGKVFKDGKNDFHKYKYVSAANVVESIKPLLVEEKLVIIPSVIESVKDGDFARVKIEYTIIDIDSGEEIKKIWEGEGMDKGDKAFYKAYTGCYKYFLMNLFDIPTTDDPEADIETDKRTYGNKYYSNNNENFKSSEKDVKALISVIYKTFDETKAKQFISKLISQYNIKDLKELSNDQINTIKDKLQKGA